MPICARPRQSVSATLVLLASLGCGSRENGIDNVAERRGLIVEEVPAGALQRAGIEKGNRLVAWRSRDLGESDAAPLVSPLELWLVEHEQAARSPVELRVVTPDSERWLQVPPGRWYVEARPALTADELDLYRRGRDALDAGTTEAGEALFRQALALLPRERVSERVWMLVELARRVPDPKAELVVAEAIGLVEAADDAQQLSLLHAERGRLLDRAGRFEEARDAYERSLELWRQTGRHVAAALTLAELGRIEGRRGDPAAEERLHRQALEALGRSGRTGLEVSRVLRGLARARATQDDVPEAIVHADRALEIAEQLAPGGFDHEAALMIQGIFYWFEEDWERAEARLLEALDIVERLDPEHEDVSYTLHNLGLVAMYRGDQAQASDYFVRALEAEPHGDPIQRTKMLNSLGSLALTRYDLVAAERWYRQVLEIRERLTPGSLNVATPLLNLGEVALFAGSLDEAEELLERALELQRRWIPESRDPAMTLLHLAMVSRMKGDLERAESRAVRALAIVRERSPGVLLEAATRHTLGAVRHDLGRSEEGEVELRRAVQLFERLAPDTTDHALAVHDLGRLERETGRREEAVATLLRAVGILERQVGRLGGDDEVRSRFRGHHLDLYRDGIELLMELDRPEEAFHLLERSRARAFLALLAERGIDPERDEPAELRASRRELVLTYDSVSEELAELSSESDRSRVEALRRELDQVRLSLEELRSRSLGAERHVLAQGEREILDLDEALDALADDTVAISYAVGRERSWAFVLGPARAFRVVELPFGAPELEDRVGRLQLLVERPGMDGGMGYRHLAAELYEALVTPAEREIERARRLVVVPDGPLHLLPFALLVDRGEDRHLIEWRPIQVAASLTVYKALRDRSPRPDPGPVLAFVDPRPATPIAGREDVGLAPLPYARREADGLRRFYGERTLAYVGVEATEGRAKELGQTEQIVHFATHGVLDPRSPLDSGLVLQPSTRESGIRDNGLLQAWEIFDGLRTSAELVTLSACESASGLRIAGEGLMSLTRAFHYAGARSVLASLWRVSDRSTSLLMERFYEGLAAGAPPDEALQAAQVEMLRGEVPLPAPPGLFDRVFGRSDRELDYRQPYYWAAFQLYGPGRASDASRRAASHRVADLSRGGGEKRAVRRRQQAELLEEIHVPLEAAHLPAGGGNR